MEMESGARFLAFSIFDIKLVKSTFKLFDISDMDKVVVLMQLPLYTGT